MKRVLVLAAALLAGACAADRPNIVEGPPPYCPAPPAIPVNAQGLVLPPGVLRAEANDWESTFAYRLQETLARPGRLAGRAPQTAAALAQLEMLGNSFERNLRFQRVPGYGLFTMRQGRVAFRDTMGIPRETPDVQVVGALLAAECALWAGDREAARAALAQVAQAPDALDLIAPPGSNSPPRIPRDVVLAASNAVPAIRNLDRMNDSPILRFGALGW
jgi:hypothetical protein